MSKELGLVDRIKQTIKNFFRRKSRAVITPIPQNDAIASTLTELLMPTVSPEDISFAREVRPKSYGATSHRISGP